VGGTRQDAVGAGGAQGGCGAGRAQMAQGRVWVA
jgi:hypothetical protein